MGSEPNLKRIDESVGGLVWVRRRNGSWWPGRIMGLHELSESLSVSPRSGTPVKLLGREDASVDWYNLEKSRRVKAFRCGEYDECIEKAKASAANPSKKAVKYARREDAILHALEIENARESDKHPVSKIRMDSSSGTKNEQIDEKRSIPEPNPMKELSQSGISFEDPEHVSTSQIHSLQKKRRKTPNDSEDDGTEGNKRMRGLEDLGVGVLSKRKASMCLNSDEAHGLIQLDSSLLTEPTICNISDGSATTRSKGSFSFLKRRQSQAAIIHENLKRKNRRRPLTKVLESTAMVSVPVLCDQGANAGQSPLHGATDSKVSALESTDSKRTSISGVLNNISDCTGASCYKDTSVDASEHTRDAGHICSDLKASEISIISKAPENGSSDGLFDVPFVGEAKGTKGFASAIASSGPRKQSSEGLDESGSTTHTLDVNSVNQTIEKRTSKWQSKGKRNSRNPSQKPSKCLDWRRSLDKDASSDVSLTGKHHIDGFPGDSNCKVEVNTSDESLASDNCVHRSSQQSLLNREGVIRPVERKDILLDSLLHEKSAAAKDMFLRDGLVSPSIPQRSLPYRLSRFTPHPKYQNVDMPDRSGFRGSTLFDVNLEVRASYTGQHVPLVSLMSKLNGKAIVGHPVTVEAWDDGHCDLLMSRIDCCPTSSTGDLYDIPKKKSVGFPAHPKIPAKHSPSPKKSPNMRKSSLWSKKTRRLSSFTVAPNQTEEEGRKPVVEKSDGPVIACVPLNVVFSRLNEALNGSTRPAAVRNLTPSNP